MQLVFSRCKVCSGEVAGVGRSLRRLPLSGLLVEGTSHSAELSLVAADSFLPPDPYSHPPPPPSVSSFLAAR